MLYTLLKWAAFTERDRARRLCSYACGWKSKLYIKSLQTFLTEDHISHYTSVRWPDILRNVIISGYVTFYQISKFY